MSIALYRKYRSKRLSEVVGQEHITSVLERALQANSTSHAYLLTGPRGTGKTSIARILAHEITGLAYEKEDAHLDIIEIDAASNNGVDDVRNLRDKALVAPSIAPKKIYIIDEVHMLSKAAFNALLKILEEPPAHVVFILATTDADKVPDTIMSRTQRYHFHLIDEAKITKHLHLIAKEENIAITKEALELVAARGGGSFRDSISLLDQLRHSTDGEITPTIVENALGLVSDSELTSLIDSLSAGSAKNVVTMLQTIHERGVSATTIASQLRSYIRQNIATQPELVHYLESLNEVAKSHHPDTRLLVALLEHIVAQPTTKAVPHSAAKTHTAASLATKVEKITTNNVSPKKVKEAAQLPAKPKPAEPKEPTPTHDMPFDSTSFDWQKILDYASTHKEQFIGVHSLLAKCTPEVTETGIKLYTGNKFNKSKLDATKNRTIISKMLREVGVGDVDLQTVGTPPPPKDEQAAHIAAMMGGGEEVDVS